MSCGIGVADGAKTCAGSMRWDGQHQLLHQAVCHAPDPGGSQVDEPAST